MHMSNCNTSPIEATNRSLSGDTTSSIIEIWLSQSFRFEIEINSNNEKDILDLDVIALQRDIPDNDQTFL